MAVDIFESLGALFAGKTVEEYPPPFTLHRFLAFDKDYCSAASEIQHAVTEPGLVFGVWQYAVPRGAAPRVKWTGQRKEANADALVVRMQQVEHISRREAEEAVELLTLMLKLPDALIEYGIDTGSK